MITFLFGISITLNIILGIGYLLIYKYSLKNIKNMLTNKLIKHFEKDSFDIENIEV